MNTHKTVFEIDATERVIAELHSTPFGFFSGVTTTGQAIQVVWQPHAIEILLDPYGAVYANEHDGLQLHEAIEQAGFTFASQVEVSA